ncbi:MAG: hypothetical protein IM613_12480 [Cytophagales bacterium]|nr:hypothetical protein [Cytophagales bacterium]
MAHVEIVVDFRPHLTKNSFSTGLYAVDENGEIYITSYFKNEMILISLSTGEAISFEDTSYKFYPLSHGSELEIKV